METMWQIFVLTASVSVYVFCEFSVDPVYVVDLEP